MINIFEKKILRNKKILKKHPDFKGILFYDSSIF
jgi:hypothetical protein